jgi:hypothetical protein
MQSKETTGVHIEGHIKIHNPETGGAWEIIT